MSTELTPLPPVAPPPAPRPPAHKSPGLAVLFSLLPGLGHVYLGLYQRGIGFFTAFFAAVWLADHADAPGIIAAFVFFFAMFDAHRMAVTLVAAPGPTPGGPLQGEGTTRGNLTLGVVLLLTGSLLLYANFYPLDLSFLADWWPLGLILFGLWLVVRDIRSKAENRRAGDDPSA